MQLQFREEMDALYVKVFGEIDLKVSDSLRQELDESLEKSNKNKLILDFNSVTFIDSSGLGVILGRYKKLKLKNGKMIILSPNPHVERVLELSGIKSLIEVVDTWENIG